MYGEPVRSYVMNSYFGCYDGHVINEGSVNLITLNQEASRTLMFCDMQFGGNYFGLDHPQLNWGGADDAALDSYRFNNEGNANTLDPANINTALSQQQPWESIGYLHHMSGEFRGHVVFLDGHIEAVGLVHLGVGSWSNRTYDACSGQY